MNKNKLKILFGFLAIIIAVGGFLTIKWLKENNKDNNNIGKEYIPQAEITDAQARQTIVSLYFPDKDDKRLIPEARIVDIKELLNLPYEKIMSLLIQGPKNDKLEMIIPKGTKVLRTYTEGDTLILDLTKDFLNYDMEQDNGKENLINSIVYTMTELTEINNVKFLIEGEENELFNQVYCRNK